MRDQNIPVLTSSVFPKHTNLSDELELQIKFGYHMMHLTPMTLKLLIFEAKSRLLALILCHI